MDHFGRILAEVLGAFVTLGALFIQGMPAIATALAIVWYIICISGAVRNKARRDK